MFINIAIFDKGRVRIDAITIGPIVFCWVKDPSDILKAHENQHVRQFFADPLLFHMKYFYQLFRNKLSGMSWHESYRNISYEIEARAASKQLTEPE